MKLKRLLAILMAVSIAMCIFVMPSSAADEAEAEHIEITFADENASEEFKARAVAHFSSSDCENHEEDAGTYGLTCTLFGHKIESGVTYVTNHKVKTTAPRCLKKTYNYETCTRCDDYEVSTLISSAYIYCCA